MKLLLDTHALIWMVSDSARLPRSWVHAIEDEYVQVFVSAASIWEIGIKTALGKLKLELPKGIRPHRLPELLGLDAMDMTCRHACAAGLLPRHHEDPFDRMLIAQAQLEDCTLVSADGKMAAYDVAVMSA